MTKVRSVDRYREDVWTSDLPPSQRFVALALSRYMDFDTLASAHPGNTRLAELTGLSIRTVRRALRDLEDAGWIKTHTPGRGTRSTLYGGVQRGHSVRTREDRVSALEGTQCPESADTVSPHPSQTTSETGGRPHGAPSADAPGAPSALQPQPLLITLCKQCGSELSTPLPTDFHQSVSIDCDCGHFTAEFPPGTPAGRW